MPPPSLDQRPHAPTTRPTPRPTARSAPGRRHLHGSLPRRRPGLLRDFADPHSPPPLEGLGREADQGEGEGLVPPPSLDQRPHAPTTRPTPRPIARSAPGRRHLHGSLPRRRPGLLRDFADPRLPPYGPARTVLTWHGVLSRNAHPCPTIRHRDASASAAHGTRERRLAAGPRPGSRPQAPCGPVRSGATRPAAAWRRPTARRAPSSLGMGSCRATRILARPSAAGTHRRPRPAACAGVTSRPAPSLDRARKHRAIPHDPAPCSSPPPPGYMPYSAASAASSAWSASIAAWPAGLSASSGPPGPA